MTDDRYDVAVLGAGPAGAACAIALCRHGLSVTLLDAPARGPARRIGENLPPAARGWLHHYGIDTQPYLLTRGLRTTWGSANAQWTDYLYSAHGPGLIVERRHFDTELARVAQQLGAQRHVVSPAARIERHAHDGWHVTLHACDGEQRIKARFIVCASGRSTAFAQRQGSRRERLDRLVALARFEPLSPDTPTNFAEIEAVAHGWWYRSPLPGGERVTLLFTDADLVRTAHAAHTHSGASANAFPLLRYASNSCRTHPAVGTGWLAVGDAAQAYDPLASAGLMKALVHSHYAAEAVASALRGSRHAVHDYQRLLDQSWSDYRMGAAQQYARVTRFADQPFWRRRHRETTGILAPGPRAPYRSD